MDQEQAFIRAILANAEDTAPWLMYADWLAERGDRRAEFLRLTVAMTEAEPDAQVRLRSERRLRQLRATINRRWLALLDRALIDLCEFRFAYRCPKQWERLELTDDEFVRFCGECGKHVHYCLSIEQARGLARDGQCVALDPTLPRHAGDLAGRRPGESRPRGQMEMLGMGLSLVAPLSRPAIHLPVEEDEEVPKRRPRPAPKRQHRRTEERRAIEESESPDPPAIS